MGLTTPSTGRQASQLSTNNTGRNAKESKWSKFAGTGFQKSIKVSDWAGGYANSIGNRIVGGERFWPTSGDFEQELEKSVRILQGFTQQGFVHQEDQVVDANDSEAQDGKVVEETVVVGPGGKPLSKEQAEKVPPQETRTQKVTKKIKKVKIIRKIPPVVLQQACGIAIYSAMRTGIAPFGGSGGSGVVLARLPDGSWSPPSFITPQNLSVGLMLGFDVYDVVLLIMHPAAMEGFMSHKFTVGAEGAVAAGPVGTGASMDVSLNGVDSKQRRTQPIFSYVRSRGAYAGAEAMAQALVTRVDENERVYHWPGITGRDILTGKVRKIGAAQGLYRALAAAESGSAQQTPSDLRLPAELEDELGGAVTPGQRDASQSQDGPQVAGDRPPLELDAGECLHLPPTPEQLAFMEKSGVKGDEDKRRVAEYKEWVWSLPAPPRHPKALKRSSGITRTKAGSRYVAPPALSKGPPRFTAPPGRQQPPSTTAGLSRSQDESATPANAHTDLLPAYSAGGVVPPPEKGVFAALGDVPPALPGDHPTVPYIPSGEAPPALPEGHPTARYVPPNLGPLPLPGNSAQQLHPPPAPTAAPAFDNMAAPGHLNRGESADDLPAYSTEQAVEPAPEKALAAHQSTAEPTSQAPNKPTEQATTWLAPSKSSVMGEVNDQNKAASKLAAPGARRRSLHLGCAGDDLDLANDSSARLSDQHDHHGQMLNAESQGAEGVTSASMGSIGSASWRPDFSEVEGGSDAIALNSERFSNNPYAGKISQIDAEAEAFQTRQEVPFSAAPTPTPWGVAQKGNDAPGSDDSDDFFTEAQEQHEPMTPALEEHFPSQCNEGTAAPHTPVKTDFSRPERARPLNMTAGTLDSPTTPGGASATPPGTSPVRPQRAPSRNTPLSRPPRSSARTPSVSSNRGQVEQ